MSRERRPEFAQTGQAIREAAGTVRAPSSLRASVAAQQLQHTPARRRVGWRPALAAGTAAVGAIVVALVIALPGGSTSGPSIARAATAGLRPANAAPPARGSDGYLRTSLDGVAFPDYTEAGGWHPTGMRYDRVGGRRTATVLYARGDARIGYVIVDGPALPIPGGSQARTYGGVPVHVLKRDGAVIVTWRRGGHTCILAAKGVPLEPLLEFATRV